MKRLWASCLIIIGLNALILVLPHIVGQNISDPITLIVGGIDLIACPILIHTSVKQYIKK